VAGDSRALGTVYDAYGAVVYGLAFAITQDAERAEAIVASAFSALWRDARTIAAESSMFVWLTARVRGDAVAARGPAQTVAALHSSPTTGMARAIDHLQPRLRQVVELAYFGGCTRSQIAERLGASEVQVAVDLRDAMAALRDLLPPPTAAEPARKVAVV
jgi:RNA polymerase sigma-70 factor (ECF subfamily)